jgi:hypothetical protein
MDYSKMKLELTLLTLWAFFLIGSAYYITLPTHHEEPCVDECEYFIYETDWEELIDESDEIIY